VIRVLVAEDSRSARELLVHILESEKGISVVDTAVDGCEAVEKARTLRPDVITMDVHMPRMDGLQATRAIMTSSRPVPILIISASLDPAEVGDAFIALEGGAIALCEKPVSVSHPDFEKLSKQIVQKVRMVSEITIVRRWAAPTRTALTSPRLTEGSGGVQRVIRLVAFGASTGGPPVLHLVLAGLPKGFGVPILIVQHIAAGFLPGLVEWLMAASGFHVEIGADGRTALPACAYMAPDGAHMEVDRKGRIGLRKSEPVNGMCPSVSVLFRSVAAAYGESAVGVLLTGMGRDGAEELKVMRDAGAVTIAQDRESSVIHGMPGEAIRLGAARHVLPPDQISRFLTEVVEAHHA
jgi:two-component system, chemotaxis family, protein-glutamate methylesterase/glutaminase